MTLIKHGVAAAITMAGALAFSGVALASSADFIDNGNYTTDLNNDLDWLDVTISVNQSYNYVSSQFGSGGEYYGWRYATGSEFNNMVSSWTGTEIADDDYTIVSHNEGDIDLLHFLLGSTLDSWYINEHGGTVDAVNGVDEGDYEDFTQGYIADVYDENSHYRAIIHDADKWAANTDYTQARLAPRENNNPHPAVGSFLVRDTLTPVPVPAAVWLMGSGLLGLLGYSRQRKPMIAA